jgi:hypothetical protein
MLSKSCSVPCFVFSAFVVWVAAGYVVPTVTTASVDISVDYADGVSESQRQAIDYACGLWEGWISNTSWPVTLRLRADVADLGDDETVADAKPLWRGAYGGASLTPAQYMAQTGTRLEQMDGEIRFNSRKTWYTGLDSKPTGGAKDLVGHTLHEIGHQMGMDSSFKKVPFVDAGVWGHALRNTREY